VLGLVISPHYHIQSLANLTSLTTSDLGRMLEMMTAWFNTLEFLQSPVLSVWAVACVLFFFVFLMLLMFLMAAYGDC